MRKRIKESPPAGLGLLGLLGRPGTAPWASPASCAAARPADVVVTEWHCQKANDLAALMDRRSQIRYVRSHYVTSGQEGRRAGAQRAARRQDERRSGSRAAQRTAAAGESRDEREKKSNARKRHTTVRGTWRGIHEGRITLAYCPCPGSCRVRTGPVYASSVAAGKGFQDNNGPALPACHCRIGSSTRLATRLTHNAYITHGVVVTVPGRCYGMLLRLPRLPHRSSTRARPARK